ncbi:site-specific integrase [Paraflavisolibacter sp. H34]|uniref:tyrosine-type recombinase/integrase n=1 Tax=Huijunlia imazamoxiresistens TaxID=3127457 RepID=UPI003019C6BF
MVRVSLFHDTRREKTNQKYPVKIRVTCNRKAKYYPTDIDLSREEFKGLTDRRTSREIADIKMQLNEKVAKAQAVAKTVRSPFSFHEYDRKMGQKSFARELVHTLYEEYIGNLLREDRVGSASSYTNSMRSLDNFKKNLKFGDITPELLKDFEKWMIGRGNSISTVGIYLRPLRAIYNEAIAQGIVPRDYYPFGKRRYQIPASRNIKKALTLAEIGKIYYYEPQTGIEGEAKGKDFWLFSYFANGINMKDVALLQYKNVRGDYLVIDRAKTIRSTRANPKPIQIFINEEMRHTMTKWGNPPISPDTYVFPILEPGLTATRQRDLIQQFIQVVNTWMQRIAQNLGLDKRITTYTARHSFSTVMKRSGASIEFISEALGHSDVKTTESYLDSFEDETKKQFASSLTAFKKENKSIE